jgi:hypothetical protein
MADGADLPRGRLLLAGDEDMLEKSVRRLVDPRHPLAAGDLLHMMAGAVDTFLRSILLVSISNF